MGWRSLGHEEEGVSKRPVVSKRQRKSSDVPCFFLQGHRQPWNARTNKHSTNGLTVNIESREHSLCQGWLFIVFEVESHYVAQAGLKFALWPR